MNTTKSHILRQYELRYGSKFLLPEIETIEDFVDLAWWRDYEPAPAGVEPYRGDRSVSPARDFYFLHGATLRGSWRSLYVRAKRSHGMAVASQCSDNQIGAYKVVKGSWPDPYALLLANDNYHIANPFISLINWCDYVDWLDKQTARLLGEAA